MTFECVTETDLVLIHSNKLNYTQLEDTHMARISHSGTHTAASTSQPFPSCFHHIWLVSVSGGASVSIKSSWLQPQTQYLVLQLNSRLRAGQTYQLYTEFTGELADDLVGFYRTEYEEHGVRK